MMITGGTNEEDKKKEEYSPQINAFQTKERKVATNVWTESAIVVSISMIEKQDKKKKKKKKTDKPSYRQYHPRRRRGHREKRKEREAIERCIQRKTKKGKNKKLLRVTHPEQYILQDMIHKEVDFRIGVFF